MATSLETERGVAKQLHHVSILRDWNTEGALGIAGRVIKR